jgi:pyruvate/2-oxoglutarate dehydrogenase complex dihydrolipoamide dehydrogenase (E3) component
VTEPWDLLVVGGGTAGIVGAKTAARFGARVALIERDRTGGDCLWTGCVPSKALLAAAGHAAGARKAEALGISLDGVRVDFPAVMRHVRGAIAHIEPIDSVTSLEETGVHTIAGEARFTGPRTVEVDGVPHSFHQALLATGAAPALPGIPGLAEADPLTSETVWDLVELPERLVVMGGGSIGCELGQAFARLGAKVTIVEALPRILSREDPDAALLVHESLEADGIEVLAGHRAVKVLGEPGGPGTLVVDDGSAERDIPYDRLLVAVGRTPRSRNLGLDRAGVEVGERGHVVTDERLRTTNARIYAAGDVTAHPAFTHVAGVHGSLAASNAVLGLRRTIDLSAVPRVTYTDPEVAAVGAASWSDDGPDPRTVTRRHEDVDRAVTDGRMSGFTRLVLDERGKSVTGGTVVGPRAGETLAEVTLAVRKGLSASELASTIHPYPTYADGPWHASIEVVQGRLAAPTAQRVTSALVGIRRAWASHR